MAIRVRVGEFVVDEAIKAAVNRVLTSGRISEGRETRDFEKSFSSYVGVKNAVALNSGTSALVAAILALEKTGEKKPKKTRVITSPLTYIATSNAIVASGMEPLFADVDPVTFSLLASEVEDALEKDDGKRTVDMLIPVHLMGYVCDMGRMRRLATRHGLHLIEDSSQAHGSTYKGKRAGCMSDASTFSFYIAHNVQAGELGAVLTNSAGVARKVRKIKANGRICDCFVCTRAEGKCPKLGKGRWDPRFLHDMIGFNFKTTEFSAAIANAQIARADEIASKRRENVRILNDLLSRHAGLLRLPLYSKDVSYLGYPLVIRDPKRLNRERLLQTLEANGVETRPLFGCIPLHQPSFAHLKKQYKGKLPNAEYLGANGFYIGCHQYLTDDDLQFVAKAFDKSIRDVAG